MQRFLAEARSWFARSRSSFVAARSAGHGAVLVTNEAARRRLLGGAGEVRALLRSQELSRRPIGSVESWPRALLGAMRVCLETPTPMWLIWGPDDPLLLYNDAAIPLLGKAHPEAFGIPAAESRVELWEDSQPSIEGVLASGRPQRLADQLLLLPSSGRIEERYFEILLSPVLENGEVAGVLCAATETTARVRAGRRAAMLSDITARTASTDDEQEAWRGAVAALERNPADLPFAVLYAADGPDDAARLAGVVGLPAESARAPARIDPNAADSPWPLAASGRAREPAPAADALVCPLTTPSGALCGYLVAGCSPRQPLDDDYRRFLMAAASMLAAGIASARVRDEHVRREASLERGRRRLERLCAELTRLYEHAPIPMLVVSSKDYVVERLNGAALAAAEGRDLLGKPLFAAVPELVGQGFDQRLATILETGRPDVGREVVVRIDRGGRLENSYFTFISALVEQTEGEPQIIIVAMDVTEQVRARTALEASEARYRDIFDSVDVSIWEEDFSRVLSSLDELVAAGVGDLRGYFERHPEFLQRALEQISVVDVNESTLRLFGARDKRELRRSVHKLFLPETWQAFGEKLIAMLGEGKLVRTDTVAATLDGERRELMMTMRPSAGEARSRTALLTLMDITERKRMEQALREADRQKDEFLATLAHELRNPLAPLRSGVDLLRELPGETPDEVLDIIERQVEHLARLANDLFESSRIRRGSYDLRKQRVALADALRGAAETSGALIRAAGHDLEMSMPDEPLWVDGDPMRLAQIFANLLNNAARYTPQPGRITVTARRVGADVEVRVTDSGIGIPPEALPKLFTMFVRLGRDEDSSAGGLGIGLALAKQLAEMHGGTVEAHSEGVGRGSTFVVRLPLADVERPIQPAAEPAVQSIAGRRLLIVEDDRDTAESLKMILEANGAEVRVASSGPKALASFASFEPDVVLLDIGLPGMSGYEVARRLRAEFASRSVLIVALTGWGREEDVKRALDAGFDDHVVKPVDIGALRKLLARR